MDSQKLISIIISIDNTGNKNRTAQRVAGEKLAALDLLTGGYMQNETCGSCLADIHADGETERLSVKGIRQAGCEL